MNKPILQILYSFVILLIVPILIALNTLLLASGVRDNHDKELQTRAELANSVFAVSAHSYITDDDSFAASQRINSLVATQKELRNVAIITRSDSGYTVFAAQNQFELSSSDLLQFDIVYTRKWPVAKSILADTDDGGKGRAWNVASPVLDDEQNVIGIVTSDYLTADIDERFDATLDRSMIIMVVSALAVIVLLFNHFKFIGYADLLRKQKEVNQTMNDFLSVASHELKAPMSIIKGYISNVKEDTFGEIPDKAKEQLSVAESQTDRLNELVQDLLNVSRIEQGRIKIEMQPVDAAKTINMIVKQYEPRAKEKNIVITFDEAQSQQWVMGDPGRIQEVFTNLIDNAVKYSVKGQVTIYVKQDGKHKTFAVRDTGIGMSAAERERLFQRFYRVKNDKTKEIKGTGLGLWIIKQYIEKMGGKITVDSLEGTGTEFQVTLQSTDPPQTSAQLPTSKTEPSS